MLRIRKMLKKLDKFGDNFKFKYNDYDKYSTSLGGLVYLFFCCISLDIFILKLIFFLQRQNFTLQFYKINLAETEYINLNKTFAFGIDCQGKEKTNKAKDLFNVEIEFKNKSDRTKVKFIETKPCENTDFDDELNDTINNLQFNNLSFNDFKCLSKTQNEDGIQGVYTDSIFTYYTITVSAKEG